jgi:hypothetical protein
MTLGCPLRKISGSITFAAVPQTLAKGAYLMQLANGHWNSRDLRYFIFLDYLHVVW